MHTSSKRPPTLQIFLKHSKLIGVIKKEEDVFEIQKDIDSMQNWANTWQMSFNYDKCKVIHFGKKNREYKYKMELGQSKQPHEIEKSLVERDMVLLVSSDLKWGNQVEKATKAAKAIIAQIRNSFSYFNSELVRLLYVSLVRPHLKFAVSVWNPYLKKDTEKLENAQHKATKLVANLRNEGYEDGFKILRVTTLETRRKRGDLIQFYKLLNGLEHINWKNNPDKNGPAAFNFEEWEYVFAGNLLIYVHPETSSS